MVWLVGIKGGKFSQEGGGFLIKFNQAVWAWNKLEFVTEQQNILNTK